MACNGRAQDQGQRSEDTSLILIAQALRYQALPLIAAQAWE
jgi:hypothetical protein